MAVSAARLRRPLAVLARPRAGPAPGTSCSAPVPSRTPRRRRARVEAPDRRQVEPARTDHREVQRGPRPATRRTDARWPSSRQQIAPLQMQVDLAMARVGAVSAQLYEIGGPAANLNALLSSARLNSFADQLACSTRWRACRPTAVTDAKALKSQYDEQEAADRRQGRRPEEPERRAQRPDRRHQRADRAPATSCAGRVRHRQRYRQLRPVACPQVYDGDAGAKAAAKAPARRSASRTSGAPTARAPTTARA